MYSEYTEDVMTDCYKRSYIIHRYEESRQIIYSTVNASIYCFTRRCKESEYWFQSASAINHVANRSDKILFAEGFSLAFVDDEMVLVVVMAVVRNDGGGEKRLNVRAPASLDEADGGDEVCDDKPESIIIRPTQNRVSLSSNEQNRSSAN